ncbi:MAG: 1-deoxy-D-xylulose-5-phosphate synthase [Clostridiales bacterium]|jgi:1-deoxy-D-xylulose-5-phosphate synthase|nr:1-deoxy-D-xylulose-5-phosphate synthase [Clostridiales bacterium]
MDGNYKILGKKNFPDDLKKLTIDELKLLAFEIRKFLIYSVSKTGGHLASNLGVVEITIALHTVFDIQFDKIIWDVGHQSYVHKILTGRYDKFATLRSYGGISGFPKTSESDSDCFNTGHSSTSISAALGFASAMKIIGIKAHAISVIGDGAMTGGMAFEALNNVGTCKAPMIIILNDNGMSISKNVGAIAKQLNKIRNNQIYFKLKNEVKDAVNKIPLLGKNIKNIIHNIKNQAKNIIIPNRIFEDFGLEYMGPIDGHDISSLITVLKQSKKNKEPVLIHIHTKKGKGYVLAEDNPDVFHGINKFESTEHEFKNFYEKNIFKANNANEIPYDKNCAIKIHNNEIKNYKKDNKKNYYNNNLEELKLCSLNKSYSNIFGEKICELALKNKKIIAITASMSNGTGLDKFEKTFPEKFFDVGIAEQHAVTFACGFAKMNFIPIIAIYSSFLQRAYDQILHDAALQNLHVIFAIDRAGIVGEDGETHQGIYDISFLSHIPNIKILAPSTKEELELMLDYSVNNNESPIAIRYPRGLSKTFQTNKKDFELSPVIIYKNSRNDSKIILISVGNMLCEAIKIVNILKNYKIFITLIDARVVKPINKKFYVENISKNSIVITLEDGVIFGGFGSLLECEIGIFIKKFGYPDTPITHGSIETLKEKYNMNAEKISHEILNMIE